ncbi:MAG: co-chaperone GroES, partial [Deltaproteobacteria bacterium]
YKEFGGTEVQVEGEDYILFTEDDLLAKYLAVDKIPE